MHADHRHAGLGQPTGQQAGLADRVAAVGVARRGRLAGEVEGAGDRRRGEQVERPDLVGVERADRRVAVQSATLVVEPFQQRPPPVQPRGRDGTVGGDRLDPDAVRRQVLVDRAAGRGPRRGTRATGRAAPCRWCGSWSGRPGPRSGRRADGRRWSSAAPMAGKSVGDGGKSPRDSVPGGWWRPVIAGSAAWTWLALGWVSERTTAILPHEPRRLAAAARRRRPPARSWRSRRTGPRSGDGPSGLGSQVSCCAGPPWR